MKWEREFFSECYVLFLEEEEEEEEEEEKEEGEEKFAYVLLKGSFSCFIIWILISRWFSLFILQLLQLDN